MISHSSPNPHPSLPPVEQHPFPPFIPDGAVALIMGTFPPQPKRWAMQFYYPNRTNDFWPMMGLIFFNDPRALFIGRDYNLPAIKELLTDKHIALHDTGFRIRRLANNASDKFLEIVEPVRLNSLLAQMPDLRAIATTGEKAAVTLAQLTDTEAPAMGEFSEWLPQPSLHTGTINIWRMPSTSRAYPLALEKKAAFYASFFRSVGIIP